MSNRANELAEQRLRDRIKSFIHDVLKSADDVVVSTSVIISVQSQEELYGHLKTRYHEYERRSEPQFKKQIAWHLNKLYSEVTVRCNIFLYNAQSSNVQKQFFKRKDFLPGQGSKKEVKQELKQA